MAREIKFRAWVPSMKKMHTWGVNLIQLNHDLSWNSLSDGSFDKHDSVLMQFTGLLDKNGKEIYEGDILGCEGKVIGHVEGGVRGYCYDVVYVDQTNDKGWSLYSTVTMDYKDRTEVIGNIYENPELLK
jgi:uncharacterized phage protein (TIGR01671 family)